MYDHIWVAALASVAGFAVGYLCELASYARLLARVQKHEGGELDREREFRRRLEELAREAPPPRSGPSADFVGRFQEAEGGVSRGRALLELYRSKFEIPEDDPSAFFYQALADFLEFVRELDRMRRDADRGGEEGAA